MPEDSLERAHDLAESGDIAGATQVLRRHLEARPGDAPAHFQLARLVLESGDAAAAVQGFQRASELAPDNSVVHNDLGTALEVLGRAPEAAEAYRRATRMTPVFPPAHYNLALMLCRQRQWDEAVQQLRAALEQAPEFRIARLQLGLALGALGQGDAARACFDHLLTTDPKDIEARRAIADMDMRDCRFADAAQQLEQCLELARDDALATLALGGCMQELGRVDEALTHYRRLLEHEPSRYYEVVKKLTSASKGRFWVKSAELRRMLLG
jgi:Flp pilus assembly protein TadD